MPYTALYRKLRPQTFGAMVGQGHIVRALANQLTSGQVSHAYLFCGTRGTGKTSAAKILARAVNCQNPQDGSPCNTCAACENILAERCLDVAEIDAASNNGVENIRDLREEVKYPPTQAKYKVYIIDEVHMLSTSAFNALLKTLEEPPAHVIFILATTDPQKIPDTILSRCQRYDFRRISAAHMMAALKAYLQEQATPFEESALEYIVYHSDGAMRDALSLLDQCLSLGGDDGLTHEKVLDILGAVDRVRLFEFTDALAAKDSGQIMAVINQAMDDGRDAAQFAADLVRHFRDVLVATLATGELEFSTEIAAKLKQQGEKISASVLMEYIHAFSETLREMRFAPHMRTAFEVCALRLCVPRQPAPIHEPHELPAPQTPPPSPQPAPQPEASTPETSDILQTIVASWGSICQGLPIPLRSWCARTGLEINDGVLQIICNNEASVVLIKKQQTSIREAIADKFNLSTPPNLAFVVREAYNKVQTAAKPEPVQSSPTPEPDDDWATFGQPMLDGEAW